MPQTRPSDRAALIEPRDFLLLAYVPLLALVAWLVPERAWPSLIRPFVSVSARLKAGWVTEMAGLLEALFGTPTPFDAKHLVREQRVWSNVARLEILRCYRWDGWRPEIELVGREHIDAALEKGQGAVLWVLPMIHTYLVTKMALQRAGYRVSHLSRMEHGTYANSRIGVRLFNWVETVIEARHVVERLVISDNRKSRSLRTVTARLRANRIVSITLGARGQRQHQVPFLRGGLCVAAGAPGLAARTGAALLPVFTVRLPDGSFRTMIEPALYPPPDTRGVAAERDMAVRCAKIAGGYAEQYPMELDFSGLVLSPTPPDTP